MTTRHADAADGEERYVAGVAEDGYTLRFLLHVSLYMLPKGPVYRFELSPSVWLDLALGTQFGTTIGTDYTKAGIHIRTPHGPRLAVAVDGLERYQGRAVREDGSCALLDFKSIVDGAV